MSSAWGFHRAGIFLLPWDFHPSLGFSSFPGILLLPWDFLPSLPGPGGASGHTRLFFSLVQHKLVSAGSNWGSVFSGQNRSDLFFSCSLKEGNENASFSVLRHKMYCKKIIMRGVSSPGCFSDWNGVMLPVVKHGLRTKWVGFISRSAQRYREVSLPFGLLEKLGLETQGRQPGEWFNPCTASPLSVDKAAV